MPVPEQWRLPDDFVTDEVALEFVRENCPRYDPRWAPFDRLSARMVGYGSMGECLAFLHQLDDDVLTEETIAWLGTGLLDFVIEEYGTDCEESLRVGVSNKNFRAMLECVSTLWDDVREMLDRVLDRTPRPRVSIPRADLRFLLTGYDLDPDDVTARLGVTSDRTGRRSDSVRRDFQLKFGSWAWETTSDSDINVALLSMLRVFEPLAKTFDELRSEGISIWLTVMWWVYDHRIEEQFTDTPTAEVARRLAAMGIELKVDVHRRGCPAHGLHSDSHRRQRLHRAGRDDQRW